MARRAAGARSAGVLALRSAAASTSISTTDERATASRYERTPSASALSSPTSELGNHRPNRCGPRRIGGHYRVHIVFRRERSSAHDPVDGVGGEPDQVAGRHDDCTAGDTSAVATAATGPSPGRSSATTVSPSARSADTSPP